MSSKASKGGFFFFCGFGDENEKFAEIRAGSLSHLLASLLNFTLATTPHGLVLQHESQIREYKENRD